MDLTDSQATPGAAVIVLLLIVFFVVGMLLPYYLIFNFNEEVREDPG